jgi:hypothetical protein
VNIGSEDAPFGLNHDFYFKIIEAWIPCRHLTCFRPLWAQQRLVDPDTPLNKAHFSCMSQLALDNPLTTFVVNQQLLLTTATFIENEHCNVSFYSSICLLALMDHDCFVIVFPSLRSLMKQHVAAAKLAPMLTTNCRPHPDPLQISHHSSSNHSVCFIPCF